LQRIIPFQNKTLTTSKNGSKVQIKFAQKDRATFRLPAESLSDFMQRINKTIFPPLDGGQLILRYKNPLKILIFIKK
jgi:hypothetical protein